MSLVRPTSEFEKPSGQIVRYAFVGNHPPLRTTVMVAEAFRAAALSAFHAITGSKDSFLFSGHRPDGFPDNEHRHVYYLPQPGEDGRLLGILVVSPVERFDQQHFSALQVIKAIQWSGPSTRTRLEMLEPHDCANVVLASHWISTTPFVPIRQYWGTHGKHHHLPEKQLQRELESRLPGIAFMSVSVSAWDTVRVRLATKRGRGIALNDGVRKAFRAEFSTDRPVCGPIAVGHSAHFGLGLFVPADRHLNPA